MGNAVSSPIYVLAFKSNIAGILFESEVLAYIWISKISKPADPNTPFVAVLEVVLRYIRFL